MAKRLQARSGGKAKPAAAESKAEGLPLSGIRVLDISSYIAAPAAAVVLGDYGADVIKVEPPGEGDPNRSTITIPSYPKAEVNYPWEMDSRNKRSIALDLKQTAARAALDRLIERCDVLIINFPIPVRERLRLTWEDVRPLNGRLIYASLTGYGEEGPDRDQPGFDSTAYFARTGLVDQLRYDGQPPHFSLPAQGDRATAMGLVAAIMMGLYQRERTGRGTKVATSLLANGLWSNGVYAQAALVGGFLPLRPPRTRPRSALGNLYRTRDDRFLILALPHEQKFWPRLCEALGRPDLIVDARFAETDPRRANAAALTGIFDQIFPTREFADWRTRLKEAGIPFSVIQRIADVPQDAQARAAGAIVETANPAMPLTIASPIRLEGVEPRIAHPAPSLGEHTDEVLREAGFSESEIAALRKAGAME